MIVRVGREMGAWGERRIVVDPSRYRPGSTELQRLGVDYTRFREHTGWAPEYSREEGLRDTIAYYDQHRDHWLGMLDWA